MAGGRDDSADTFGGEQKLDPGTATWTGEEASSSIASADVSATSRYSRAGTIGKGAIGVVRSVFDERLGRTVAYKSLKDQKNAAMAARFLREARITAQLEHPGIVAVHDLGTEPDGTRYYTMRYVKGATLEARFAACKTLPERLALLGHFVDLCQAMGFAHSRGVVHRDLKPANVMVGEHGETQLLDWGLAKEKGEAHDRDEDISRISRAIPQVKDSGATVMGTVLGTPSYMSPEQASGDVNAIDARSDVWSLGVMLFELLAGERPFDGKDPWEVIARVRRNERPRLADLVPLAPPELVAITERALAARPADRYPSGAELAADVDAWMTGGRVAAYRYSLRDEAVRYVRRRRAPLSVAAVLGTVLVVGATAAFVQIVGQRDRAVSAEATARSNLAELYAERAVERLETGRNAEAALFAATSLVLRENPDARGVLLAADAHWPVLVGSAPVSCHDAVMRDENYVLCATGKGLDRVDLRDGSVVAVHDHPVTEVEALPDEVIASFGNNGTGWFTDVGGATRGEQLAGGLSEVTAAADGAYVLAQGAFVYLHGPGLPEKVFTLGTTVALVNDPAWGWVFGTGRPGALWLKPGATETVPVPGTETLTPRALAFEPGANPRLALGTADGAVAVVDLAGKVTSLPAHRGAIGQVAFVDANVVASIGEDGLLAFASPDGRLLGRLGIASSSGLQRSPAGRLLTMDATDQALRLWEVASLAGQGDVAGVAGDGLSAAGIRADGSLVTFHGSGVVRSWTTDGKLAAERSLGTSVIKSGVVTRDYIAAGRTDGAVSILDPRDLSVRVSIPMNGSIGLDATPDGALLFASVRTVPIGDAGKSGVLAIDPQTGTYRVVHLDDYPRDLDAIADKLAFVGELKGVFVVDFDGNTLAFLDRSAREVAFLDPEHLLLVTDSDVALWTWRDGTIKENFLGGDWHHGATIDGIAVSRDGALIATASWDRSVGLWDAHTGALRAVLRGHDHRVADVSFSADGEYVVSASWDGLARRWALDELTRDPASVVAAVRDQVGLVVEDGRVVTRLR